MRRVVACALILLMCLCFLPTAQAALEMPMGEFECAYNKNILHANGKNHSFDTAQRIVSKEWLL